MAKRGARPKPTNLRVVTGSHRGDRHGDVESARSSVDRASEAFGPLRKPAGLKGEALRAWARYIEPAFWLDAAREPAAVAFCELWQEFRGDPAGFQAAKHAQMRAYMSELGLTDERNRVTKESDGKEDPAAQYFA